MAAFEIHGGYSNETGHSNQSLNLVLIMLSVVMVALPVGINIKIPYSIRISVMVLWYFDCIIRGSRYLKEFLGLIAAFAAIILFEFFYLYIGYSDAAIGNYYNTLIFYDMIIKAFYVMFAYRLKDRAILFRLIQVYLMISCYFSGVYGTMLDNLYEEGGLSALLNEVDVATTPTEYYNMLIFYVSSNVYMLIQETKNKYKILDVAALLAALFFIFSYHTRATSLFLIILLSALVVVNKKNIHYSNRQIVKTTLLFSIITLLVMFVAGNFIIGLLPERVAERTQAMLDLFTGEGDGADSKYLGRFELTNISINTWLTSMKTFLFGVGNHLGRDYYGLVGQHSFFIDYLAKYGIIGGVLVATVFKKIYKSSKCFVMSDLDHFYFRIFYFVYILLSFLAKSAFAIIALGAFLYSLLAISTNNYQKQTD